MTRGEEGGRIKKKISVSPGDTPRSTEQLQNPGTNKAAINGSPSISASPRAQTGLVNCWLWSKITWQGGDVLPLISTLMALALDLSLG
jgi:hypothetical protein